MNIEWENVVPELRKVVGAEMTVLSSFSECRGSFKAVFANLNEGKRILHFRKLNIPEPRADEIFSLAECHFVLTTPNKALRRAFTLRAVRKSKEELILTQEPSLIPTSSRDKIKVSKDKNV